MYENSIPYFTYLQRNGKTVLINFETGCYYKNFVRSSNTKF